LLWPPSSQKKYYNRTQIDDSSQQRWLVSKKESILWNLLVKILRTTHPEATVPKKSCSIEAIACERVYMYCSFEYKFNLIYKVVHELLARGAFLPNETKKENYNNYTQQSVYSRSESSKEVAHKKPAVREKEQ